MGGDETPSTPLHTYEALIFTPAKIIKRIYIKNESHAYEFELKGTSLL